MTEPRRWRGYYGCSVPGESRLVRLDWNGPTKKYGPSPKQTVDCPVCGRRHVVEVMWRIRGEKELRADLVVG